MLLSESLMSLKSNINECEKKANFLDKILEQSKREKWSAAQFITIFKITGLLGKAVKLPDNRDEWEGLLLSINLNETRQLVSLKGLYYKVYSEYVAALESSENATPHELIRMTKALRKARAEISRAKNRQHIGEP